MKEKHPLELLTYLAGLADPTRVRMLRLLERQELGVGDLCQVLQLPQSTVSRHLKLLREQGWLVSRSQKTTHLCRMATDGERAAARRRLWQLVREDTEGWATTEQDRLRLGRLLERKTGAGAFFAGAAGRWDRLRVELYGTTFTATALFSLLPSDWTLADLGCGTGEAAAALSPHVARVIGVDQSAAMLKAARKRTASLPNVELRQGSFEALPLESGSCDGALLLLGLSYVIEPERAAAEMARVLRKGGRAVVVDLLRHDREDFRREMGQQRPGFEPAELARLLGGAGLEKTRVRTLPPESGAKGPALVLATGIR